MHLLLCSLLGPFAVLMVEGVGIESVGRACLLAFFSGLPALGALLLLYVSKRNGPEEKQGIGIVSLWHYYISVDVLGCCLVGSDGDIDVDHWHPVREGDLWPISR